MFMMDEAIDNKVEGTEEERLYQETTSDDYFLSMVSDTAGNFEDVAKVKNLQTYLADQGHSLGGTGVAKDGIDGSVGKFTSGAVRSEMERIAKTRGVEAKPEEDTFTSNVMSHLKLREGFRPTTYLDTLGKPTGGTGHLLSTAEQKKYPEGTEIPEEVTSKWLKEDSAKAITAAETQVKELPQTEGSDKLKEALVSVNFQMGTNWRRKFPSAWKAMKAGDWKTAIDEITHTSQGSGVKSQWNIQTPTRVQDFVSALQQQG